MRAMVLEAPGSLLQQVELPQPEYGADDVLLKVSACGVCRETIGRLQNGSIRGAAVLVMT